MVSTETNVLRENIKHSQKLTANFLPVIILKSQMLIMYIIYWLVPQVNMLFPIASQMPMKHIRQTLGIWALLLKPTAYDMQSLGGTTMIFKCSQAALCNTSDWKSHSFTTMANQWTRQQQIRVPYEVRLTANSLRIWSGVTLQIAGIR